MLGTGIMQTIQNYGYDIVLLVALLVVASMFVGVSYHAYTRYSEIHTGRATWGQLACRSPWARLLLVVGIWLLTKATGVPLRAASDGPPSETPARHAGDLLPHRLNRQPVVVRGLTADELWICAGLSVQPGFARPAAGLAHAQHRHGAYADRRRHCAGRLGRRRLPARAKRGRPDTWLYRQLEWRLALRYPALAALLGGFGPHHPFGLLDDRAQVPIEGHHEPLQERGRAPAGHVKTLRLGATRALFVVALLLGFGWWSAPGISPSMCRRICARAARASGGTCRPECVCLHVPSGSRCSAGPRTARRTMHATCARCRLPDARLPDLSATGL